MTREELIKSQYRQVQDELTGMTLFGEPIDVNDPRQCAIAITHYERLKKMRLDSMIGEIQSAAAEKSQ